MFSDFYFYLIAFINDIKYDYPAFFRIDRIKDIKDLNEKYDEVTFREPNRCVGITAGEGKFTDTFIKKTYKQGWDYNTFRNVDLKKMGY